MVSISVMGIAYVILGEYESGFKKVLEVKSIAAGTYLVQVQINFQIEMKRLIINK